MNGFNKKSDQKTIKDKIDNLLNLDPVGTRIRVSKASNRNYSVESDESYASRYQSWRAASETNFISDRRLTSISSNITPLPRAKQFSELRESSPDKYVDSSEVNDDFLISELKASDEWNNGESSTKFKMTREIYESYQYIPSSALREAQKDEKGNIILDDTIRSNIHRHQEYERKCKLAIQQNGHNKKRKRPQKITAHPDAKIYEHDIVIEGPYISYDEKIEISGGGGKKFPKKIFSIGDLNLHENVKKNCTTMNIKNFRPIQQCVIPLIMEAKNDAAVYARTGHGKTAAYLVPLVNKISKECMGRGRGDYRIPRIIVFVYTNMLATQICERAMKLAGNRPESPIIMYAIGDGNRQNQIKSLKNTGCDMLIATTGRFLDLLNNELCLDLQNVDTVIFDEADRFTRGDLSFNYEQIKERSNQQIRTYFFSSTYSERTIKRMSQYLVKGYWDIQVGNLNQAEKLVQQHFVDARSKNVFKVLWNEIKKKMITDMDEEGNVYVGIPKTIIFVNKKEETDLLADILNCQLKKCHLDTMAVTHHAEMIPSTAEKALKMFKLITGERADIIVATDRLAAGIDFPGVKLVINFGIPISGCDYIQRIGRTGRNGHYGDAITILYRKEIKEKHINALKDISFICNEAGYKVPEIIKKLTELPVGRHDDSLFW